MTRKHRMVYKNTLMVALFLHTEVFMLVLSRKPTERLRLGGDIVVTVLRVAGDKVRLGIEAPDDVLILRDEITSREPPLSCENASAH